MAYFWKSLALFLVGLQLSSSSQWEASPISRPVKLTGAGEVVQVQAIRFSSESSPEWLRNCLW